MWPARVEILGTDGNISSGACDYPKGDPENPISQNEAWEKFRWMTREILPMDRGSELLEQVMGIDEMDDVCGFMFVPH